MTDRLAVAIGKFDALHRGHRALAEQAAHLGEPLLLGFAGMATVLGWPQRLPLVATGDRARVLDAWSVGIGRTLSERSLDFARIQPLEPAGFVALLAEEIGAAAVVVGDDFRFGRGRAGGAAELADLGRARGLAVAVVPVVTCGAAVVSSSRVRDRLAAGDCADVAACLDRPYRLVARVVRGEGRGRALGFPTANCGEPENQPPGAGVYAGRAWIDGRGPWPAAINAGHLPTVGGRPFAVEAHLVGFAGECYGARIELDLLARLRGEQRFAGLDELRAQIGRDVAATVAAAGSGGGQ